MKEISLPDIGKFSDDPNRSFSIPGIYYFDPDVYAMEMEAIFSVTWQYVCHVSSLPNPGSYAVREIGDQSVIVIRDQDGGLRAHHNVCQHRAHRLLEGNGQIGSVIVCPYHNWTYDLTGELKFARHADEVKEFDNAKICLSSVLVDTFCGFVFVNLDSDAEPLAQGLQDLEKEIRELSPDVERLQLAHQRNIDLAANWKNSVENYSECYHCPNQHPGLSKGSLDMSSYQITVHDKFHSHASRGVGKKTAYARSAEKTQADREFGSWLLWPNFCLEVYPGGYLNVFHHLPQGPEKTLQLIEWFFPQQVPTAEQQQVIDFVDSVRNEDIPLCETVQKGLHSRGYTQGRLIANENRGYYSEHAVHDFQKKVITSLGMCPR
jgi:choline monooxygenase